MFISLPLAAQKRKKKKNSCSLEDPANEIGNEALESWVTVPQKVDR